MVMERLGCAEASRGAMVSPVNVDVLIQALRTIDKPVCTEAAKRLARSTKATDFDLHLRSAGLTQADARVLADAMASAGDGPSLRSFSASYNPDLGDAGVVALAEAFPTSMRELGLVGCVIGDVGGRAILKWAKSAPELGMICVEGNAMSAEVRAALTALGRERQVMVVV